MDRKRKLEEDYDSQSGSENSPSKSKRHSLDFKLNMILIIQNGQESIKLQEHASKTGKKRMNFQIS